MSQPTGQVCLVNGTSLLSFLQALMFYGSPECRYLSGEVVNWFSTASSKRFMPDEAAVATAPYTKGELLSALSV